MGSQALTRAELESLDSMWKSPGYLPTIVAVAAAFGSWSLLLPIVPLAVINDGGSEVLAGATTGVFMAATVLTQMMTPRMVRRFGYIPVMALSAALLGVPSLGYLFGTAALPILLVSAIRGVGFGALTVSESALIAELVPVRFLGKASGTLGLAVGLAELIFLPLGLYMADKVSFSLVYVLGAVIALVAALMCALIPKIYPEKPNTKNAENNDLPRASTWKLITVPALGIFVVAMGFGAVSSFLPAAVRDSDPVHGALAAGFVLSIVGGAQMVFRYLSGIVADRQGQAGGTMIPALLAATLGLALMAAVLVNDWPSWLLFLAAFLYGGGFGSVQNEALLTMFMRMPRSRVSEASALWNISFDGGTGTGSFLLGMAVVSYGFAGAFGAAALVIFLGFVATVLDRVVGHHRISELDNTKARLRQVTKRAGLKKGARKPANLAGRRNSTVADRRKPRNRN